ncbi:hypothetical protein EVAR_37952_1 [Eumeta japonica]|uniref:Uncharacterized protein n=1 Tax=Eumeta variegata TaxID=151549 RepID=A0A4C1XE95_EUMVA|nr:hypothetical protein EVAR_37952_1 [Eumeta japonica]
MFPKTVASESGARRDVLAEMAARIPPPETSQVDRGRPPIKVGDAVVTDPALPRNTAEGIVERVYPGIDGQVSGGHSHGPWTAETTNCAPGGPAYRSGVVARSDRGGLLTAELRPPCAAVAAGEGCGGRTSHWPRGKRRARTGRRPRSAQRCYMRARPATVSPPSTADEETLSLLRVLKRSSGPPSARRVEFALFADDTTLYLRSSSVGHIIPRLQRAIDELTQ